jgi:hypothetical protein
MPWIQKWNLGCCICYSSLLLNWYRTCVLSDGNVSLLRVEPIRSQFNIIQNVCLLHLLVHSYLSYPLPKSTYCHVYTSRLCFSWVVCYFYLFFSVWPKAIYTVYGLLHCTKSQIIFSFTLLNIGKIEYFWNFNYAGKYEQEFTLWHA